MADLHYRLLDEPLLSVGDAAGRRIERLSLPALYATLVRDGVGDFPALRPHQRHVWHAFLVQVAALALHRAGVEELPDDPHAWREMLLGLTPDDPDGAAWSLVAPPQRPALLQPPAPGGDLSGFKNVIEAPDSLDMLVTAKNHDIKASVARNGRPEHWIYALVSLQTQEGFLGRGNYGVSRMNGGFSSRPGFGVAPPGGPGARVARDISRLLSLRDRLLSDYPFFPRSEGIGLVWLNPWDGGRSLEMSELDPFYVEICRRVRVLQGDENGSLRVVATGTTAPRIDAKALVGCTGDPWTPLVAEGIGRKALTADKDILTYKRLTPLIFPSSVDPQAAQRAPLQEVAPDDASEGLVIMAHTLVRGQGKTEGYHERHIPVSRTLSRLIGPAVASDAAAKLASERVEDAGMLTRRVLFPAVLAVFTGAPSSNERKRDDDSAKKRAGAAVGRLDAVIDASFFVDLDAEVQLLDCDGERERVRAEWILRLRDAARVILGETMAAAPSAAMRSYRTRVRARRRFDSAFHRHFGERVGILTQAVPLVQDLP